MESSGCSLYCVSPLASEEGSSWAALNPSIAPLLDFIRLTIATQEATPLIVLSTLDSKLYCNVPFLMMFESCSVAFTFPSLCELLKKYDCVSAVRCGGSSNGIRMSESDMSIEDNASSQVTRSQV